MALRPEEIMGITQGLSRTQAGIGAGMKAFKQGQAAQREKEINSVMDLITSNTFVDKDTGEDISPKEQADMIRTGKIGENVAFAGADDGMTAYEKATIRTKDATIALNRFKALQGSKKDNVSIALSTAKTLMGLADKYEFNDVPQGDALLMNAKDLMKQVYAEIEQDEWYTVVNRIETEAPGFWRKVFQMDAKEVQVKGIGTIPLGTEGSEDNPDGLDLE
jgi:hypothetical protein